MNPELINTLIVSIPALSSVASIITAAVWIAKKVKKVVKDPSDDVRSLRKDYKEMNKQLKEVIEINKNLNKKLENYDSKFQVIENKIGDLTNAVKEKQLQQEATEENMDTKSN